MLKFVNSGLACIFCAKDSISVFQFSYLLCLFPVTTGYSLCYVAKLIKKTNYFKCSSCLFRFSPVFHTSTSMPFEEMLHSQFFAKRFHEKFFDDSLGMNNNNDTFTNNNWLKTTTQNNILHNINNNNSSTNNNNNSWSKNSSGEQCLPDPYNIVACLVCSNKFGDRATQHKS